MAKKIIQDIVFKKKTVGISMDVPAERNAVRQTVKSEHAYSVPSDSDEEGMEEMFNTSFVKTSNKQRRGGKFLKLIYIVAVAVIVIFVTKIALSSFSKATIVITPRQKFIQINSRLTAYRGSQTGAPKFEIMQLEKEITQDQTATGISEAGQKASGQIIIFNTYSSRAQKLISRTRFETPDGKIYRIKTPISIPGFGSVEVTVYADAPGAQYNLGLTDFTIPGLKGDPRFDKIYGRSKTVMSGGADADSKIISEQDIAKAKASAESKIREQINETLFNEDYENYVVYEDAIVINFTADSENPGVGDETSSFAYKTTGEATGFLIKKDELAKILVENYLTGERNVGVANLEDLDFTLLGQNSGNSEITFEITGNVHFVWQFDEDKLKQDLITADRRDPNVVFVNYPNIDKAEIIFSPQWYRRIPKRTSRIVIEEVIR